MRLTLPRLAARLKPHRIAQRVTAQGSAQPGYLAPRRGRTAPPRASAASAAHHLAHRGCAGHARGTYWTAGRQARRSARRRSRHSSLVTRHARAAGDAADEVEDDLMYY